MSIRILLVDDHQMMREGLRVLLASEPGLEVVGEACDGRTALSLVRSLALNVVVMDIEMPGLNGVESVRLIRAEHPGVKIVALSMHYDRRFVCRMLDAGASAYVPKIDAANELVRAVRAVHSGQMYLSPAVAGFVVDRFSHERADDDTVFTRLSAREREVLQLVAEGKSSPATAKLMHISIKTVETHRRNIVQKLDIHGTAELTKYAVREGLTSLEC